MVNVSVSIDDLVVSGVSRRDAAGLVEALQRRLSPALAAQASRLPDRWTVPPIDVTFSVPFDADAAAERIVADLIEHLEPAS